MRLLAAAVLTAALLAASAVQAADAEGCKDPSWAPQRMPAYEIASCETREWDSVRLSVPEGDRIATGRRTTVTYQLTDESKDSGSAAKVTAHYRAQALKAGGKLASGADDTYAAYLVKKGPQGETWMLYDHGNGSETSTGTYTLTTIEPAGAQQQVEARPFKPPLDLKGCKDPAWLAKNFPQYQLSQCDNRDFDSLKLDLPDGEKTLVGRIQESDYTLKEGGQDVVAALVKMNFANALQKLGAKVVSAPDDPWKVILTEKRGGAEFWYLYEHAAGNENNTTSYNLITVQVGGPAPAGCKLAIYGVNFDFDKATLRPEGEPVLQGVVSMLGQEKSAAFEIGGHTDATGKAAYNLKLSGERAEAVRAWLVAHGVDASRLTARGYGDTQPLVPNDSDAHRAKNRRVELKKTGCR